MAKVDREKWTLGELCEGFGGERDGDVCDFGIITISDDGEIRGETDLGHLHGKVKSIEALETVNDVPRISFRGGEVVLGGKNVPDYPFEDELGDVRKFKQWCKDQGAEYEFYGNRDSVTHTCQKGDAFLSYSKNHNRRDPNIHMKFDVGDNHELVINSSGKVYFDDGRVVFNTVKSGRIESRSNHFSPFGNLR